MPNKLTDSEIVKALESYINDITCAKCGFKDQYLLGVIISILDLINRQKAENEWLNKEVDRLSQVVLYNDGVTEMKVEEAKAEAYKECIEKVKEMSNKMELVCSGALVQTDYTITEAKLYNLLKELVGDK